MPCANLAMSKATTGEAYAVLLDANLKESGKQKSESSTSSRGRLTWWLLLLMVALVSGAFIVWQLCALRNLQRKVIHLENQVAALAALDLDDLRSQLRDLDELRDLNSDKYTGLRGQPTSADEDAGSSPPAETQPSSQDKKWTPSSSLLEYIDSVENDDDSLEDDDTEGSADSGRQKRQADLSSHTQDGIPIFDRGYGVTFNRTEGLRIYQSLLATGGRGEPRSPDLPWDVTDAPIQPHHRRNSFWRTKEKTRSSSTTTRVPLAPGDSEFNPQFDALNVQYPRTTSPSVKTTSTASISVRASRVKPSRQSSTPSPVQGDQKSWVQHTQSTAELELDSRTSAGVVPKPTRIRHQGSTAASVPQAIFKVSQPAGDLLSRDQAAVQATADKEDSLGVDPKLRNKKARPGKKQLRKFPHGVTAVHLVADAKNGSNNAIDSTVEIASRNELGLHTSWKMSNWHSAQGAASFVKLDGATVTMKQNGLYFVYAQVHYLDEHPVNSYEVFVNTEPFLRCVTSGAGSAASPQSSTCYTAAVTVLYEGDKLFVRDIEPMRYSVQQPSKTFFGLVRLANIGH